MHSAAVFMHELLPADSAVALATALGIGLLIGAERERRKGTGSGRDAAGIRTFSIVGLMGAVAQLLGSPALTAVVVALVGLHALQSYRRSGRDDPGLTTEVALILTCLLGVMAVPAPAIAAAAGIVLAALLVSRQQLHGFVKRVLTEQELDDVIVLGAILLVVMPLAPDRFLGPLDAINPRQVMKFIVLVMLIGALGHIAMRIPGQRLGLLLAGFAGGFISSTATVYQMAQLSRDPAQQDGRPVAAAIASCASTYILLALMVLSASPALLMLLLPSMGAGMLVIIGQVALLSRAQHTTPSARTPQPGGHAFSLTMSFGLAGGILLVTLLATFLYRQYGANGALAGAAAAGLADTHSATASLLNLAGNGVLTMDEARIGILAAFTTNALTKTAVAMAGGTRDYATKLVAGVLLMLAFTWAPLLL